VLLDDIEALRSPDTSPELRELSGRWIRERAETLQRLRRDMRNGGWKLPDLHAEVARYIGKEDGS
jgi:hypothetical protein